jgi:glutamate:Na+ symporter, ESS family
MNSWLLELSLRDLALDFSMFGVLLVMATVLRRHSTFLQHFLIPNNLIAGVIGLVLAALLVDFGLLNTDRLGSYVYHLLALLFIALGLRKPTKSVGLAPVKFSIIFIMTYLVQGLVGLGMALLLVYTIMPDLFAGIGMLLPLGFGMNPGIAFSMGNNWENYGFESGGTVGLSFAAIGFVIAYTVGIIAMRRGIQEGKATYLTDLSAEENEAIRTGIHRVEHRPITGHQATATEAIESLTLHVGFIMLTYACTFAFMLALEQLLYAIGAEKEILTLWSFHFIIAAIMAMLVRRCIDVTNAGHWIDDATMTRMGNIFMDFMVVASVAAITIAVVVQYWIPLILLSLSVGIATWYVVKWACNSLFDDFTFERDIVIFGNLTGTMQSALVLLRVLDPKFKSPVSYDLVYGSGFALLLGLPLLILINAPVNYFDNQLEGYWLTMVAMGVYLAFLILGWNYLKKK